MVRAHVREPLEACLVPATLLALSSQMPRNVCAITTPDETPDSVFEKDWKEGGRGLVGGVGGWERGLRWLL